MARTTFSAPARLSEGRQFRLDIQGLRAVAVLLILAYHAGLPISGGYIGVDVFFVISGFLITSHLLSEISAPEGLNFGRFYARRARRILPASLVVLIATVVGSVLILPPGLIRSVMQDAIATALYVPNILFAWRGTDYLAETAPSPFQHYWSLGVEEQFYLVWPLILVLLWRLSARDRRWFAVAIAVLVLASFAVGLWLTETSGPWAFFSLQSRAWQLGVGALLAVVGPALLARIPERAAGVIGWVGLVVIVAAAFVFDSLTPFPGVAALAPVLGAAAIIASGQASPGWGPVAIVGTRPFQFIGAISYSLYLVHWPLVVFPNYITGTLVEVPTVVTTALSLVAIPLAWLLYRTVETPLRASPWLAARRPRVTLIAALAASVAAVLIALAAIAVTDNRPTSAGKPAGPTSGDGTPTFTPFVPSDLNPTLAAAAKDLPAIYANGCHLPFDVSTVQECSYGDPGSSTVVVLFGDSHAAQWFPALEALAEEHGFRLYSFTKSSCPSVDVPIIVRNASNPSCTQWRGDVIDRIAEIQPTLIIISNLATYTDQGAARISDEAWSAGLERVLDALPDTAELAVLADTPSFVQTVPVCLSANLHTALVCGRAPSDALNGDRDAVERAVAERTGALRVDLTPALCSATLCGPIIGSTLVYRDTHHLTATFAALLSTRLWGALSPLINK